MRFRSATLDDLEILLRHRIRMFTDMGHADSAELANIKRVTREYMPAALAEGRYYGLLAETSDGEIVAGGGVVIAPWPGAQQGSGPRRAWILNVYVEPEHRRRGIARISKRHDAAKQKRRRGRCPSAVFSKKSKLITR